MSGGNLHFAVQHAHIVEAIEECCPPVTAPYLQAAYDRMKLGVHVAFKPSWLTGPGIKFVIWQQRRRYILRRTSQNAAHAYLRLCETLTEPAPASSLSNRGAQTVGEQSSAHSIRSAVSTADDAPAPDSLGASAASPSIPGGAALNPGGL